MLILMLIFTLILVVMMVMVMMMMGLDKITQGHENVDVMMAYHYDVFT